MLRARVKRRKTGAIAPRYKDLRCCPRLKQMDGGLASTRDVSLKGLASVTTSYLFGFAISLPITPPTAAPPTVPSVLPPVTA